MKRRVSVMRQTSLAPDQPFHSGPIQPVEEKKANENDKKEIEELPLANDEKEELKSLELKLSNSHKNVLRKLIAVWIFQMSFCFFILLDTY